MKRPILFSYVLPALLFTVLWVICLSLQGGGAPALDGNGPYPGLILWFLFACALGGGLVLTTLYALLKKPASPGRWKGRLRPGVYHLVLWLVLGITLAGPHIQGMSSLYAMRQSPERRVLDVIPGGGIASFERRYGQALRETREPAQLNAEVKSAAVANFRIDVLRYLKSQGVQVAEPGEEDGWIENVLQVLRINVPDDESPRRLDMVKWLLAEGEAQGFSLKARAGEFASTDFYLGAYDDIDAPGTRELLHLLTVHGADTVGCREATSLPCPLVYIAGRDNAPLIRYLLSQGANPNAVDAAEGRTALSEAIGSNDPATMKLLLAAGARLTMNEDRNDLVDACWLPQPFETEQHLKTIGVLHEVDAHLSAEDLARYKLPIDGTQQRNCVQSFMREAAL